MGKKRTRPRPPKPHGAVQRQNAKLEKPNRNAPADLKQWLSPISSAVDINGPVFFRSTLDDASVVIISTSVLDKILQLLIIMNAGRVPSTVHLDRIFGPHGSLSTFSSKIELCFLMGHLLPDMRHDLDNIRYIRNEFCHATRIRSFDDADIALKCGNLRTNESFLKKDVQSSLAAIYGTHDSASRSQFCKATFCIIVLLFVMIVRKYAHIKISLLHSDDISALTHELLEKFSMNILKTDESESEEGPMRHPQESTAPAKSEEAPIPPPPSSPG